MDAAPLKHVLRFILEVGYSIIKRCILILFMNADTTQKCAVLPMFGGNIMPPSSGSRCEGCVSG